MQHLYRITLFAFFCFLSTIPTAYATDYFWVGGSGNWSDLSHWATSSGGPGNTVAQAPQSVDNVYFDQNSDVGGTAFTVNINQTANFNDMLWTDVPSGTNISGSSIMRCFGDFTLFEDMGTLTFSTPNLLDFDGDLKFLGTGAHTIEWKGNKIQANKVEFENTGGSYSIIDVFYYARTVSNEDKYLVNNNQSGTITFQDSVLMPTTTTTSGIIHSPHFQQNTGNTVFNGFFLTTARFEINDGNCTLNADSKMKSPNYPYGLVIRDGTLNMSGGNTHLVEYLENYSTSNTPTWDITNSTINIGYKIYSQIVNPAIDLIVAGSEINVLTQPIEDNPFVSGSMPDPIFITSDKSFHIVNIMGTGRVRMEGESSFHELNVLQSAELLLQKTDSIVIEDGGGSYFYDNSRVIGQTRIVFENNTTFNAIGSCSDGDVYIEGIEFEFSPTTTVSGTRVSLYNANASGPNTPYNIGSDVTLVANYPSTGWSFVPRTPRVLYWAGPLPVDINDKDLYGIWHDDSNWSTTHPVSNAPQCIPTSIDSVVFPDDSYVKIENRTSTAKSMVWQEDGVLYASSFNNDAGIGHEAGNKVLNLYGSLEFSPEMNNEFYGDVFFRAYETGRTILSAGKKFNRRVVFRASADNVANTTPGEWILQDSLIADYDGRQERIFVLFLEAGHLLTNDQTVVCNSFLVGENVGENIDNHYTGPYYAVLSLGSSDVIIERSSNAFFEGQGFQINKGITLTNGWTTINSGTSHIKFVPSNTALNNSPCFISEGGHRFHKISYLQEDMPTHYMRLAADTISNLVFNDGGKIELWRNHTSSLIDTLSSNKSFSGSHDFTIEVLSGNDPDTLVVGYADYFWNTNFDHNINYTSKMQLHPGGIYELGNGFTQSFVQLGATLVANGNCQEFITINGGNFSTVSNQQQMVDFCNLSNNYCAGDTFTSTNSSIINLSGLWVWDNPVSRDLYWINNDPGSNLWNDPMNWTLTNGIPDGGNCPPTIADNVFFTDESFVLGADDTVNLSLSPGYSNCNNMTWTTSTFNPIFFSAIEDNLQLHGSLQFSANMNQRFVGDVVFRGNSNNTIRSNGQSFNRHIYFTADEPYTTGWTLLDSLTAPATYTDMGYNPPNYVSEMRTVFLEGGELNTNGKKMTTASFIAPDNGTYKKLTLDSSTIQITNFTGYPFIYPARHAFVIEEDTATRVDAGTSTIVLDNGCFGGGGHQFHNITFSESTNNEIHGIMYSENDTFNCVSYYNSNAPAFLGLVSPNDYTDGGEYVIGKLANYDTTTVNSLSIYRNNRFDTLTTLGGVNFVEGANFFNHKMEWSAGKTYLFPADSIQHLSNQCEFLPVGVSGNEINWFSDRIPDPAYIRKDSGKVCADYIYIHGIHAIGNGSSLEGASCSTPGTPWLCDTTMVSSFEPTIFTAGRSTFTAGEFSDDQGANAGWDFSSYLQPPDIDIVNNDTSICYNDSVQIRLEIVGEYPFEVRFKINNNTTETTIDSLNILPSSGSGTIASPYIWKFWYQPTDDTTAILLETLQVNRCYNNFILAQDSLRIYRNPSPGNITVDFGSSGLCFGDSVMITATSDFGSSYFIYSAASGGSALGTTPFQTQALFEDTLFFIDATTTNGCSSNERDSVELGIGIQPPNATCQEITAFLTEQGTAMVVSTQIDDGSFDNCTAVSISNDTSFYSCADLGSNAQMLYVVNQQGIWDSCSSLVNIVDTIAPTAIGTDVTLTLEEDGTVSVDPSSLDSLSTDNCAVTSYALSQQTFSCDDLGANNIIFTASDASGNQGRDTITITIESTDPLTLNCPADETILLSNCNYIIPAYDSLTFEGCENYTALSINQDPPPGTEITSDIIQQVRLEVTRNNTIIDSCTFNLTFICDNKLLIPNIITPNADGKNDYFEIIGLEEYENNTLSIYNRWGNLIYHESPYQNDWNGKVVDGTYFYLLVLEPSGESYKGFVEVREANP